MKKNEALELLAAYDDDPDGFFTCDALCTILDAMPGQPAGEYTVKLSRFLDEE